MEQETDTTPPLSGPRSWIVLAMVALMATFLALAWFRPGLLLPETQQGSSPEFSLIDQQGRPVAVASYRGQYPLFYFGYASCPDICPADLTMATSALRRMGAEADGVQPVFVSVDYLRDGPETLAPYVKAFHPRLAGLSGSREQIERAAAAFGVLFQVKQSGEEVTVDHSTDFYLLDPAGRMLAVIPGVRNPQAFEDQLRNLLP